MISVGDVDAPINTRSRRAEEGNCTCIPSALPGSPAVTVNEGYALWAPSYDHDPNPLLALEERTLEGLLPDLAGKPVLDIGCGTGRWLQRRFRSATGVDLSADMLSQASKKPGLQGRLVRGDCLALPFRSEAADFVMCSFVIGHVRDLNMFARELARVTRPRADCYVTDVHPAACAMDWRTSFRHAGGRTEIVTFARSVAGIQDVITTQGFGLIGSFEPCLGAAEKPIFERARKQHLFDQLAEIPALLVCHFTRLPEQRSA